jgi:hypothetical protein
LRCCRGTVDHQDAGSGRNAFLLQLGDECSSLQHANLLVVEGDVVVGCSAVNETVVVDNRNLLGLGLGNDRLGCFAVECVEHEDLDALCQHRLSLLLLLRSAARGVLVENRCL